MHLHPRPKKLGVIYREIGKCTPGTTGAGEIWTARVVYLVVLACVLRASTEKKSSTFLRKKVHQEKILATPMQTVHFCTFLLSTSAI